MFCYYLVLLIHVSVCSVNLVTICAAILKVRVLATPYAPFYEFV